MTARFDLSKCSLSIVPWLRRGEAACFLLLCALDEIFVCVRSVLARGGLRLILVVFVVVFVWLIVIVSKFSALNLSALELLRPERLFSILVSLSGLFFSIAAPAAAAATTASMCLLSIFFISSSASFRFSSSLYRCSFSFTSLKLNVSL